MADTPSTARGDGRRAAIPRTVWVLGFVSLFMDLSSEMIHAVLPLYMASVLGASIFAIGIIEGIAEATALVVKVFSGALSDAFRKRKPLVLAGYGLAAFSKFVFPLAPSLSVIVAARFADRVGKGIRGAPRDALIADVTPTAARGRSFGLRQALDTVGAIGGTLAALGAMAWFGGNFQIAFWIAVVPAFLAMGLLLFGVQEPDVPPAKPGAPRWRLSDAGRLPAPFYAVTAVAAVFTLARFSEAFLVLRAQNVGLSNAHAPIVMVVMTVVYAATSYPAGSLADRGRGALLMGCGLLALFVADVLLAYAAGPAQLLAGAALWGLHMGLTQGLLAALVAAAAPPDLRGTAFGVFNLVCGVALLVASGLAGWLWQVFGPALTFYAGAAITAVAWIGLFFYGHGAAQLRQR
jgi:MFS family permease